MHNGFRGLAWCVPFFFPFWGLAVGICAAIWGGTRYNHFPQVSAPLQNG